MAGHRPRPKTSGAMVPETMVSGLMLAANQTANRSRGRPCRSVSGTASMVRPSTRWAGPPDPAWGRVPAVSVAGWGAPEPVGPAAESGCFMVGPLSGEENPAGKSEPDGRPPGVVRRAHCGVHARFPHLRRAAGRPGQRGPRGRSGPGRQPTRVCGWGGLCPRTGTGATACARPWPLMSVRRRGRGGGPRPAVRRRSGPPVRPAGRRRSRAAPGRRPAVRGRAAAARAAVRPPG